MSKEEIAKDKEDLYNAYLAGRATCPIRCATCNSHKDDHCKKSGRKTRPFGYCSGYTLKER